LEQKISSIFRVEKYAKQEHRRRKLLLTDSAGFLPGSLFLGRSSRLLLPAFAGFLLGLLFDLEAQQICSSENVDPSSCYTASQPKFFKNIYV
jgi:hypothetical protein